MHHRKHDWLRGWPIMIPPGCNLVRVQERLRPFYNSRQVERIPNGDRRAQKAFLDTFEAFMVSATPDSALAILSLAPELEEHFWLSSPDGVLFQLGLAFSRFLATTVFPTAKTFYEDAEVGDEIALWVIQLEEAMYLMYLADQHLFRICASYRDNFIEGAFLETEKLLVTCGAPISIGDEESFSERYNQRQMEYGFISATQSKSQPARLGIDLPALKVTRNIFSYRFENEHVERMKSLSKRTQVWLENRIAQVPNDFGVLL